MLSRQVLRSTRSFFSFSAAESDGDWLSLFLADGVAVFSSVVFSDFVESADATRPFASNMGVRPFSTSFLISTNCRQKSSFFFSKRSMTALTLGDDNLWANRRGQSEAEALPDAVDLAEGHPTVRTLRQEGCSLHITTAKSSWYVSTSMISASRKLAKISWGHSDHFSRHPLRPWLFERPTLPNSVQEPPDVLLAPIPTPCRHGRLRRRQVGLFGKILD